MNILTLRKSISTELYISLPPTPFFFKEKCNITVVIFFILLLVFQNTCMEKCFDIVSAGVYISHLTEHAGLYYLM